MLFWVVTACLAALPFSSEAKITERPLADFLTAQGTSSDFFPPFPDYVGWANADDVTEATNFCLVDYAGLAGEYMLENYLIDLGTRVRGSVYEKTLPDGSAKIWVVLRTTNALGFIEDVPTLLGNFDSPPGCETDPPQIPGLPKVWDTPFSCTQAVFGNKARDVAEKAAAPALGFVWTKVTFTIPSPGDPLPNLLDITGTDEYDPVTLTMRGSFFDGNGGLMRMVQKATGERIDGSLLTDPDLCGFWKPDSRRAW
jgi:hypothetical protein